MAFYYDFLLMQALNSGSASEGFCPLLQQKREKNVHCKNWSFWAPFSKIQKKETFESPK